MVRIETRIVWGKFKQRLRWIHRASFASFRKICIYSWLEDIGEKVERLIDSSGDR